MSIRGGAAPLGPVHVRLTGLVRGDEKGPGIGIVNAPTAAEATAELHRVARVAGADKVVSVAADYRRAALAGGTTSTQWRIEVQAWGTAMAPVKIEPSDDVERKRDPEAAKAKDQDAAKKTDEARDAQDDASQAKAESTTAAEQAAAQQADAAAPPQTSTDTGSTMDSATPPPASSPSPDR
ncbi:hypothetical protein [Sphingomonas pituitosa]|uniref:hypothetical protein n=1 Tax=Sphingomonas pituitosa TaxID=99597 RepID=UPI001FE0919B|nr:hypothetical protein [Sphingomonas pituitosa]